MRIPTLPRSVSPPGSVRNGRWEFLNPPRGHRVACVFSALGGAQSELKLILFPSFNASEIGVVTLPPGGLS